MMTLMLVQRIIWSIIQSNAIGAFSEVVRDDGFRKWITYDTKAITTAEAIKIIAQNYDIRDISIRESDTEECIIYFEFYIELIGHKQPFTPQMPSNLLNQYFKEEELLL